MTEKKRRSPVSLGWWQVALATLLVAGWLPGCPDQRQVVQQQTIYALQDESREDFIAAGQPVLLLGVVITGLDDYGPHTGDVYVQEVPGGAYSGVRVLAPTLVGDATQTLALGARVIVTGTKAELEGPGGPGGEVDTETVVTGATLERMGPGGEVTPWAVTPPELAPGPGAERYEGVLVGLQAARVVAHDPDGHAVLASGLRVGDDLTDAPSRLLGGSCYSHLVGLVTWQDGYLLQPRAAGDITLSPDDSLCASTTVEICDDGLDNDGDGFSDCLDGDCWYTQQCQPEAVCDDGLDNDGDGDADCDDSDCLDHPACAERDCTNGLDDDGDGLIDCRDADCDREVLCWEAICDNGIDDDGDGLIDCQEFGCRNTSGLCREFSLAECTDGLDNDGDGLVDCEDDACRFHDEVLAALVCSPEGTNATCEDGLDNDGDTFPDCHDWGCNLNPWVTVCADVRENTYALCTDGIDHLGSDDPDCLDTNCRRLGFCVSPESGDASCTDGLDNDGNGDIDCEDSACRYNRDVTVCEGDMYSCADGLDNDGNGLADCEDPACRECDDQGNSITRSPVCAACSNSW